MIWTLVNGNTELTRHPWSASPFTVVQAFVRRRAAALLEREHDQSLELLQRRLLRIIQIEFVRRAGRCVPAALDKLRQCRIG